MTTTNDDNLRAAVERLADTIHGDDGNDHNVGCEGEPDCLACVEHELRSLLADHPPTPDAECCASGRCEVCSPGSGWNA